LRDNNFSTLAPFASRLHPSIPMQFR